MTVFVNMGDPATELAALLKQIPSVQNLPGGAIADVVGLLREECIDDLLSDEKNRELSKSIFSVALSMISSMTVQDVAKFADRITTCVSKDMTNADMRLWLIVSLFNAVNIASIKYRILLAAVQCALKAGQAASLVRSMSNIDQWIREWSLDDAPKAEIINLAADLYDICGQTDEAQAARMRILSIKSDNTSVKAIQTAAATKAIVHVFKVGKILLLDNLLATIVARGVQSSPIVDLLRLMCEGSIHDLDKFCKERQADLTALAIDSTKLRQYLRSLELCSFVSGEQRIELSDLVEALELKNVDEAEQCFIDAVSFGLVEGQIDQTEGSVTVSGCTYRSINEATWKDLQRRLHCWRDSVGSVLPWSQHVQNLN